MCNLSFIVPVYKVAPYLCKCVDSLLAQDYEDYEIILVDDGSPDECPQICDSYADIYDNIRVVHRENGGLSAARNSGLEVAKGEYVCFVDSDDYWEENVLVDIMNQVTREQLDVLRFDYHDVNEKYEVFEPNKTPRKVDKSSDIVDGETYLNTRMGYACYAWQWIIRRSLIYNDGMSRTNVLNEPRALNDVCLFTEGIHFEDVDWMPRMMLRAERVNSTQTVVYNYLHRLGSITMTGGNKEKMRKNLDDEIMVIQNLVHLHETNPKCLWLRNMYSDMASGVLTTVAMHFYDDRKGYIRKLRELHVFPLKIADQGRTYVRRARMINIVGANLYCIIMRRR